MPCTPQLIAMGPNGATQHSNQTLNGASAFWVVGSHAPDGGVLGVNKDGGGLITYATTNIPQYVAADEKNLYFLTNCDGAFQVRLDGGSTVMLPGKTCTFGYGGLVLDDAAVYVGGMSLLRVSRGAGSVAEVEFTHVDALAADCTDVYWVGNRERQRHVVAGPNLALAEGGLPLRRRRRAGAGGDARRQRLVHESRRRRLWCLLVRERHRPTPGAHAVATRR